MGRSLHTICLTLLLFVSLVLFILSHQVKPWSISTEEEQESSNFDFDFDFLKQSSKELILDFFSCDVKASVVPPQTTRTNQCSNPHNNGFKTGVSDLKSSLNHRADAFNPNSKRFNPTTTLSKGGKASRKSRAKAAKGHAKLIEYENSNAYSSSSDNLTPKPSSTLQNSPSSYVLISSFVQSVVENCWKHGNFSQDCLLRVGEDVGLSVTFVTLVGYVPIVQLIPLLRTVYCSCKDVTADSITHENNIGCLKGVTHLSASIIKTMGCSTIPIVGPVLDGIISPYMGDWIDSIFNKLAMNSYWRGINIIPHLNTNRKWL